MMRRHRRTCPFAPLPTLGALYSEDDGLFRWQDGSDMTLAAPNYEAWAPGAPRGDKSHSRHRCHQRAKQQGLLC